MHNSKPSAIEISKYIIRFFQKREDPITNLKLQKLLYYVQGWYLGLYEEELFSKDFQAWINGPVVPEVFQQYKDNRWNPIVNEVEEVKISDDIKKHVDEVLEVYGGDTGWALEMRTRRETPWINARGGIPADESSNNIISKESMKLFFNALSQSEVINNIAKV